MERYKEGFFFSEEFVGESSWNGFERNCLFAQRSEGGGAGPGPRRFEDVGRPSGADGIEDGRGVAVADLDGDGALDLVVNNNAASPTVYFNRSIEPGGPEAHWLRVALEGRVSNRDAVGARVRLSVGDRTLTRWVEAGSGYASQAPAPVHFGLGSAPLPDALEVTWPSGRVERLDGPELALLGADRTIHLTEGAVGE